MAKSSTSHVLAGLNQRIRKEALEEFGTACLVACGAKPDHARIMAEVMCLADVRGIPSHGFNRLAMYCEELSSKVVDGHATPTIDMETPALCKVNGQNAMGGVIAKFSMEKACAMAKESGVGWVVAHRSNHYGIAGYWTMMAAQHGLMGMSFTNTSPVLVPTRAKKPALGTNPIAISCPVEGSKDPFVFDAATTAVALGKAEVCDRAGNDMPRGWGVDSNGKATTNPKEVLNGGGLMPLGGEEVTAGYKGYGLSMMVDMLCMMAGSHFGPNIPPWSSGRGHQEANLGQCFIAIDAKRFDEGYFDRMRTYIEQLHGLEAAEGEENVLVPGDRELENTKISLEKGVGLHKNLVTAMNGLADSLNVPRPKMLESE